MSGRTSITFGVRQATGRSLPLNRGQRGQAIRRALLLVASILTLWNAPRAAAAAVKPLYLYGPGGATSMGLNRLPSLVAETDVTLAAGALSTWTLSPATVADLTLTAGVIRVDLYLRKQGPGTSRTVQVDLDYIGATSGVIGTDVRSLTLSNSAVLHVFQISLPADLTLAAGSAIRLTVSNTSSGGSNRRVRVAPNSAGNSAVNLNVSTVISVDSLDTYDGAYPGGNLVTGSLTNSVVYLRAVVGDPFGSYDVTSAAIDVFDPNGVPVVTGASMTEVFDSAVRTKSFEYAFSVPAGGPSGVWTAEATGVEGTEGTVVAVGSTTFGVGPPSLVIMKTLSVLDDPVNGTTNPKAIPGANVLYSIRLTNSGFGPADAGSVIIVDALPPDLELFVGDAGGPGSGPVLFLDGTPASGLSYTFTNLADATDGVSFDSGGGGFGYVPAPGIDGYDATVAALRIEPSGPFNGTLGSGSPYLELRFRARVR